MYQHCGGLIGKYEGAQSVHGCNVRSLARPRSRGSDLKLVPVLIQGSNKLVQGKILAKGIEAQQLGQQLQGALAHYGCLVLQPACAYGFIFWERRRLDAQQ